MAHNLEIIDNQASFFSVKEKAWHGLGNIIENCPNLQEAIKLSKTDFEVEKQPLFLGNGKEVPNKFANVRTDNGAVVGVVGKAYQIVQNKTAFSYFDFLQDEACFETGGVLGNGNIVFLSCKLPHHFSIAGDTIENYIVLTTSHDGTLSLMALVTPVRVVCNNTLNAALRKTTNKYKVRHTESAEAKIKSAHKLMGIVNNLNTEMENVFTKMQQTKISDANVQKLIQQVMAPKFEIGGNKDLPKRTDNIISSIYEYYNGHETQQNIKGSLWGVYNAFTGFNQNNDSRSNESKMTSVIHGNKIEQTAFDLMLTMV